MKEYPYVPGWRINKSSNKPKVKTSVLMLTKHGIAEGEWEGSDWVQYRWSCIVKDSDVLYWIHLEDLTQLEKEGEENGFLAVYKGNHNWEIVRQEVELEKEYKQWWETRVSGNVNIEHTMEWFMHETARHFYELGKNSK